MRHIKIRPKAETVTASGVPSPEFQWTPEMLGKSDTRIRVAKTIKARMRQNGGVDVFTKKFHAIDCTPDFNNAISTFAVFDADGENICYRDVRFCSMLEFVLHYVNDWALPVPYQMLNSAWAEGALLVDRKRILSHPLQATS